MQGKLTEKMQAFVDAFIVMGEPRSQAYKAVLASNPNVTTEGSARTTAINYLKDPRILAALRDEAGFRIKSSAPKAQEVVEEMMTGQFGGMPVKPELAFKAAQSVLDRAGLAAVQKVEHSIEDHRSVAEITAQVNALLAECKAAGLPVESVIDITAVPVPFEDPELEAKAAPHGRKVNGLPKQSSAHEGKRLLPGPEAYRPEPEDPEVKRERNERYRAKKRAEREAQRLEDEQALRELMGE